MNRISLGSVLEMLAEKCPGLKIYNRTGREHAAEPQEDLRWSAASAETASSPPLLGDTGSSLVCQKNSDMEHGSSVIFAG